MTTTTPSITECMAAMAAGDIAFLDTLLETNHAELNRFVRRILRDLERHDLAGKPEAVAELVVEAGYVILDNAAEWRPGSVRPWTWARAAIRERLTTLIESSTAGLDPAMVDRTRPARRGSHPTVRARSADLEELTSSDPSVAAVVERVTAIVGERNGRMLLEYRVQQIEGDPMPASTVAAMFELTPDNVRQIVRRARVLLARAATQPGNEPLSRLAWVAA